MTDSRFTTVCDDLESLLAVVDIDGIEDLDTLVMALLDRPVSVTEGWDEDGSAAMTTTAVAKSLFIAGS